MVTDIERLINNADYFCVRASESEYLCIDRQGGTNSYYELPPKAIAFRDYESANLAFSKAKEKGN